MNAPRETLLDDHAAARAPTDWSDANQRWLVAAFGALRERLLARTAGEDALPVAPAVVAPVAFTPALLRCARVFGLSTFECELLLLATGIELDQGVRDAVAVLRAGTRAHASFGLALGLLAQPHWDALSPDAALRHWLLLEPEPGLALVDAPLRLDERVLHFVAGVAASDSRLRGIARYVDAVAAGPDGTEANAALCGRIVAALQADEERGAVVVLQQDPPDAAALRDLALAAAAAFGRPPLWIASADLPSDPAELMLVARLIDREAALTGALPVSAVEPGSEGAAAGLADLLRTPLLWLGASHARLAAPVPARRVLRFDLTPPNAAQSQASLRARWQQATQQRLGDDRGDADDAPLQQALCQAGSQFQLGALALDGVIERVAALPAPERAAAFWPAAREAARGGLESLAQRIDSRAGFADLVLPPAQIGALRDIARQLRQRERVFRDWGFGDTHARGQGLTALFAGESGTGKTLAAEAIANEVALDLYRVDLATLVSKYIGETEKNLKRLFDAAESSGAVLLFDEADALFGKRSEVKDSHDRYANIEVAYLLQRVEAYRGLAILTTNMKSALDRAFLRRIRFVVTFPFPDAPAREKIWRRQFPPRAPLAAVDFGALARWHVAGGHIRSIALNAAFKAADGSGRIDQAVIVEAARAEFAKLERSFNEAPAGGAT
jgi:hypothetical protein